MNETVTSILTLVEALGPLAWAFLALMFVVTIAFLGVFLWLGKKMIESMNKPFLKSEWEEANRELKQQIKELKRKNRSGR